MIDQPTDRRIDKLLHLLVENATIVVPGPKIAGHIGVARSTVWMWIEKLRAHGVEIVGYTGDGYQLRKLPDLLTPSLVSSGEGECELGRKMIHYFLASSTNAIALRIAADGAPHGTVVIAEEQTAGRGRFGRTWYSEKSAGIYASVILRPRLAPSAAPALTLAAGLAVYEAVASVTGLTPDIRWPNDLLLDGKKVGGILTEMSAETDRIHAVVVGVGLNVNHAEMPAELRPIASSLRIAGGKGYSRIQLFAALLRQLQRFYALLLERGSGAIAKEWERRSSFARGKRVRVTAGGAESIATTEGLDPAGALRLRFDDGRAEALTSGEVFEIK